MRHSAMFVALVLLSFSAAAGTITSISPSTINVNSGEQYITIFGTDLGDFVSYSGPGGNFTLEISGRGEDSVLVYVPFEVVATAGDYSVVVLGGPTGDSNAATLSVVEPQPTPLTVVVPELVVVQATGPLTTVDFAADVSAFGGQDPNPVVTCDPPSGSGFAVGPTIVTCTATNSFGETAQASFEVFVQDFTPPTILSITATPNPIRPANKKLVPVTLNVSVTDDTDPAPVCSIYDVTSNQAITSNDYTITGPLSVSLRATRSNNQDRTYTVHVTCTDASANTTVSSVNVTVEK